jgi:hypothetical protein
MLYLWSFLVGEHKENCLVKITDVTAQVKRFLLHFYDAKNLSQIRKEGGHLGNGDCSWQSTPFQLG